MKKFFYKSSVLALVAGVLLTSCDPEIDAPVSSAGSLDLTKYVAVGNSLTAGYQDGGLYREAQLNSYPAILAEQFETVGGGEFVQPLFPENQATGSGYLRIDRFENGRPVIVPVEAQARRQGVTLPGGPALTKFTAPVNNIAVPGMSVLSSATPVYGGINPFFERLLTDAEVGSKSYIQKVAETQPTFFTLWLGNIDILTYATNGAVANPANPFGGKTPVATFKAIYTQLVRALVQGGQVEGLIANIPDVTSIPFFNTVTLASVRQAAGNNNLKLYIRVGEGPTDVRELGEGDLILLSTQAAIGRVDQIQTPNGPVAVPHGFSPANPLNDNEVLDRDEVTEVKNHTASLNTAIAEVAAANNIPVFDVNTFFKENFSRPYVVDGVVYTSNFITGNVFSLDGVHLTPRGYAIVANEMIKVINAKYGSNIPQVDITQYRAVLLP